MTKGYCALVGFDISKGGMFALFKDENKARKWVKKIIKLHLTINPKLKAEGKIEVTEVKKCDIKSCKKLIESNERFCLGCEDILNDIEILRRDKLEVDDL